MGPEGSGLFLWADRLNLNALTVLQLKTIIEQKIGAADAPVSLIAIENIKFDGRYPFVKNYIGLAPDKKHNKILKIHIASELKKVFEMLKQFSVIMIFECCLVAVFNYDPF